MPVRSHPLHRQWLARRRRLRRWLRPLPRRFESQLHAVQLRMRYRHGRPKDDGHDPEDP